MTQRINDPRPSTTNPGPASTPPGPVFQRIESNPTVLGEGMPIHRVLPSRLRRMVGAWCFADHFGPSDVAEGHGMRVGPHPHIGLQTVTWMLQGEVLHRDSLGSLKTIVPGQLNVMTAGRGISHSEESPVPRSPDLHGVQLWVALPEAARHGEPLFDHYPSLPVVTQNGFRVTVLVGEALGQRSPARVFSPLVGLDFAADGPAALRLPLREDFEYAALVLEGEVKFDTEHLEPDTLLYLGRSRSSMQIRTSYDARFVLLGGEPFGEDILMWWNFVARSKDELTQACLDWNARRGSFGEVLGYDGARLLAPLPPWVTRPDGA